MSWCIMSKKKKVFKACTLIIIMILLYNYSPKGWRVVADVSRYISSAVH